MKTVFILMISLLASIQMMANEADTLSDTLHLRMEQREPHLYQDSTFELEEALPNQVDEVRERVLNDLLAFAWEYELFDLGFSYELDERTYSVANAEGEVIGYTLSVWIYKNGNEMTRRFYVLNKRVDGVFYVGKIANYDIGF